MYSSVVGSAIIDYHVKDDNGTGVLTAEAFRRAALRLRQQQTPAGLLATLTYISLYLTTNFKYIIQKIRINKYGTASSDVRTWLLPRRGEVMWAEGIQY